MAYSSTKPNQSWIVRSILVFGVFMLIDLLFHMVWTTSGPYLDTVLEKMLYTAVFACIYAPIFDKASQIFGLGSHRMVNGLVFSVLFCLLIFMAVGLMLWLGATIYIDMLQGFHGAPPPPDTRQTVLTGTQVVTAGLVLSGTGKTEDNPR